MRDKRVTKERENAPMSTPMVGAKPQAGWDSTESPPKSRQVNVRPIESASIPIAGPCLTEHR